MRAWGPFLPETRSLPPQALSFLTYKETDSSFFDCSHISKSNKMDPWTLTLIIRVTSLWICFLRPKRRRVLCWEGFWVSIQAQAAKRVLVIQEWAPQVPGAWQQLSQLFPLQCQNSVKFTPRSLQRAPNISSTDSPERNCCVFNQGSLQSSGLSRGYGWCLPVKEKSALKITRKPTI